MSIVLYNHTAPRQRNGFGTASFALAAISMFLFFALSGFATIIHETETLDGIIGVAMSLIWILNLIGIGLGIAGLAQRSSGKSSSVWGLVLNFAGLALSVTLIAIGLQVN
jgi:hypothetical protein